jgi:hypothetical protein
MSRRRQSFGSAQQDKAARIRSVCEAIMWHQNPRYTNSNHPDSSSSLPLDATYLLHYRIQSHTKSAPRVVSPMREISSSLQQKRRRNSDLLRDDAGHVVSEHRKSSIEVWRAVVSPCSAMVASVGANSVCVHELDSGDAMLKYCEPIANHVLRALCWLGDDWIAVGGTEHVLALVNVSGARVFERFRLPDLPRRRAYEPNVSSSPSSSLASSASSSSSSSSSSKTLFAVDDDDDVEEARRGIGVVDVLCVPATAAGDRSNALLLVAVDAQIQVWRVSVDRIAARRRCRVFVGAVHVDVASVRTLVLSPDRSLLLCGCADRGAAIVAFSMAELTTRVADILDDRSHCAHKSARPVVPPWPWLEIEPLSRATLSRFADSRSYQTIAVCDSIVFLSERVVAARTSSALDRFVRIFRIVDDGRRIDACSVRGLPLPANNRSGFGLLAAVRGVDKPDSAAACRLLAATHYGRIYSYNLSSLGVGDNAAGAVGANGSPCVHIRQLETIAKRGSDEPVFHSIDVAPDRRHLVLASSSNSIWIYRLNDGSQPTRQSNEPNEE